MKVAFCIREDYLSKRGGDTVQLLKTKESLEKLYNIEITVITNPNQIQEKNPDICHIFNLQTKKITQQFMEEANRLNKKVALSTIFWDPTYNMANLLLNKINIMNNSEKNINFIKFIINVSGKLLNKPNSLSTKYKKYLIDMIEEADILLPNSIEEIKGLCNFVNVDFKKFNGKTKVVVNAVDINLKEIEKKEINKIPKNYILECARIEPTKNQYAVVKALYNDKEIPIVFVGNQKSDPNYFGKVKEISEKRGNVFFIDEVSHEEVMQYYKNAAIHILPSFRESPGLSTLEALYNGCKIIIADNRFCPVNSYFGETATVINPMDTKSIKDGVLLEYSRNRNNDSLKENLINNFTWDNAAKQTMNAYESICNIKISE